jgi:hypothetical protein
LWISRQRTQVWPTIAIELISLAPKVLDEPVWQPCLGWFLGLSKSPFQPFDPRLKTLSHWLKPPPGRRFSLRAFQLRHACLDVQIQRLPRETKGA